ncbi:unnamed protein product [Blepharisma stoltei]|uniref:Uncharacterized protein n=1 Tax=Blepharisma stoltei TaxID=1481888 RepID=A0AAU9JLS8_9CILI|nr:unnamed protein product [Blepharisma stoltei]
MKLIGLLIIILLLTHTDGAKAKFKDMKIRKNECLNYDACKFDKTENCLNRCLSEKCYLEFYGNSPLEEGQVDREKYRVFNECLKNEEKELRNRWRNEEL